MAAAPPFKGDMKRCLDWIMQTTRRHPVEIKLSLQKGVVPGHLTHWIIPMEFKTGELQKHHTVYGAGGAGNGAVGYLVNLETWKKLRAYAADNRSYILLLLAAVTLLFRTISKVVTGKRDSHFKN